MSREKQIEEMRYLADEMGKAISTEIKHQYIKDERKLEEVLKANGWRKSTEVAEEIFGEIDEAMLDHASGYIDDHWLYVRIAELKKKYTESEKDDGN